MAPLCCGRVAPNCRDRDCHDALNQRAHHPGESASVFAGARLGIRAMRLRVNTHANRGCLSLSEARKALKSSATFRLALGAGAGPASVGVVILPEGLGGQRLTLKNRFPRITRPQDDEARAFHPRGRPGQMKLSAAILRFECSTSAGVGHAGESRSDGVVRIDTFGQQSRLATRGLRGRRFREP